MNELPYYEITLDANTMPLIGPSVRLLFNDQLVSIVPHIHLRIYDEPIGKTEASKKLINLVQTHYPDNIKLVTPTEDPTQKELAPK